MNRRARGNDVESSVCEFLISQGYQILERNFYTQFGELDIIAVEGNQIVFVEVRSIQANEEVSVYELLPKTKIHKLEMTINFWLEANAKHDSDWRFDFVGVTVNSERQIIDMQHLKNAEI